MTKTTEELNVELLAKCEEAQRLFPHIDPLVIGRAMKFAMVAGMAIGVCEKRLAADGKTLSEAGVEFVLSECLKHTAY